MLSAPVWKVFSDQALKSVAPSPLSSRKRTRKMKLVRGSSEVCPAWEPSKTPSPRCECTFGGPPMHEVRHTRSGGIMVQIS